MSFIQRAQGFLRRRESFRTGMMKLFHLLDFRASKESRNPLPELTPQVAKRLYEYYRQGKYADVMLTWEAMEEVDDILGVIVDKRYSALKEMDSGVKIDSESVGDDPALQRLAEEQQDMLSRYYASIENLQEGIQTMASASFRGFAMLEPIGRGKSIRLEPVHQWLMARPVRGGAWYYNADANSSCARLEEVDTSLLLIREVERPINIPVMFAICAKAHTIDGWDGLIDVFGNPAIFFEMPPGTSDERAAEYDGVAQRIIGDGRGSFPAGGKITTVETQARNGDIFFQRAEWCEKQIVRRGTGGLLTVMTEAGSGTLAGNAHQETFRQIAAAEGADISECFNKQFSASLLNRYFPGKPHLAYWSLEFADKDDVGQLVTNIVQLAAAGYRVSDETATEITGMELTSANMDSTALYAAKAVGYVPTQSALQSRMGMPMEPAPQMLTMGEQPAMNRMVGSALVTNTEFDPEGKEVAPLSPEELALLEKLTRVLPNPEKVEAEAKSLENALKEAIKDFVPDGSSEKLSYGASPLHVAGNEESEKGLKNSERKNSTCVNNGIMNNECRAQNPTTCRYHHPQGSTREKQSSGENEQWHKGSPQLSPEQNHANLKRGVAWATKNKKDLNDIYQSPEMGSISLPYGRPGNPALKSDDGYGLAHIQKKHGSKAVNLIPEMLAYGKMESHPKNKDKIAIKYKGHELYLTRKRPNDPKAKQRRAWLVTNFNPDEQGKNPDHK